MFAERRAAAAAAGRGRGGGAGAGEGAGGPEGAVRAAGPRPPLELTRGWGASSPRAATSRESRVPARPPEFVAARSDRGAVAAAFVPAPSPPPARRPGAPAARPLAPEAGRPGWGLEPKSGRRRQTPENKVRPECSRAPQPTPMIDLLPRGTVLLSEPCKPKQVASILRASVCSFLCKIKLLVSTTKECCAGYMKLQWCKVLKGPWPGAGALLLMPGQALFHFPRFAAQIGSRKVQVLKSHLHHTQPRSYRDLRLVPLVLIK